MTVVEAFRADFPDEVAELNFDISYDLASFLAYYGGRLTLAGLSRITGVGQGQLSHYITGHRNPSTRTVEKINYALHAFADELSQVHFV